MRTLLSAKRHTQRLCMTAMLAACALMIAYAEHLLPPIVPLPGIKPGFANIAVCAAFALSPACALGVSLVRILVFALLFGSPVSFVMSLCGGVLSYLFLFAASRLGARHVSFIGLSVASACCHNIGQLLGAALLTSSAAPLAYFPVLCLSAALCGSLSGLLLNFVYPFVRKYASDV